jgi:hypothetical protein
MSSTVHQRVFNFKFLESISQLVHETDIAPQSVTSHCQQTYKILQFRNGVRLLLQKIMVMEDWGLNPSQSFKANSFSKKNPNLLQSKHMSPSFTKTYTSHLWQYSLWHKLECSTWLCKCKELARSTRWSNDMKFCRLVTEIHFHTKP